MEAAIQESLRQESSRHDGGPLEKSHIRDMVLRNAVENVAHAKKTKHLESQKKAFERQNTRDNEEMRSLLQRLKTSSLQTAHLDGDMYDSDEDIGAVSDEDDIDGIPAVTPRVQAANPYPVTIVPRFGATPQPTRSQSRVSVTNRSDDLPDSMSSLGLLSRSSLSSMVSEPQPSTRLSHDEDLLGDWLARPDAISSVRRQRKSVNEQSHRKVKLRSNDAYEPSFVNSPRTSSHSRSNSLKEKKRSVVGLEDLSETRALGLARRSRSLKERKHSNLGPSDLLEGRPKPMARSFSMLTKCSLQEFDQRQNEKKVNRKTSDRSVTGLDFFITSSKGDTSVTKNGSFKTKRTTNENITENGQMSRKNSRKGKTQSMQGKFQEGDTLYPRNESSSKKLSVSRRKLGSSSDTSPNISPLTKENDVFRF